MFDEAQTFFVVELTTTTEKICETYQTYEEAVHRIEQFPIETLTSIPFIFEALPDGSQRLIRQDRKPLQWHRLPEDLPPGTDIPFDPENVAEIQPIDFDDEWDDEPLPLSDALTDENGESNIRVVWIASEEEEKRKQSKSEE